MFVSRGDLWWRGLVRFAAAEGASRHCEPMALGLRDQRIFDWLDETLGL
jgi:hypothetical protein